MSGTLVADVIRAPISALAGEQLESLEVFEEIGSTNSYLLDQPAPPAGRFRVALTDYQTAGRGRMERKWQSPKSTGLCLSITYTFSARPPSLPCLTLAIGVGAVRSMENLGIRGIGLKWPNDLIVRNGKLGGILSEVHPAPGKNVAIVIGIGINYDFGGNPDASEVTSKFGSVIDLASVADHLPSRSAVSTALIEGLYSTLAEFEAEGFSHFEAAWPKYDWLRGQNVSVGRPDGSITGTCQGIESDGALILQTRTGRQRVTSGSVSFPRQVYGQASGIS